jgi:hypothetical protein
MISIFGITGLDLPTLGRVLLFATAMAAKYMSIIPMTCHPCIDVYREKTGKKAVTPWEAYR